jgi:hypothetical protein
MGNLRQIIGKMKTKCEFESPKNESLCFKQGTPNSHIMKLNVHTSYMHRSQKNLMVNKAMKIFLWSGTFITKYLHKKM